MFLNDESKGGLGIAGYTAAKDAIMDLVVHLRAMFQTQGVELHFVPVGDTPPKDRA